MTLAGGHCDVCGEFYEADALHFDPHPGCRLRADGATYDTHDTITEWLAEDDYPSLYGYTLQVLKMVMAYPDNDSMRQQALDVIRADDDHRSRLYA